MKKGSWVISLLALALVVSNVWWVYKAVDVGIKHAYQEASLEDSRQALAQALAIINVISSSNATRPQVVDAAQKAWSAGEPFEKDGYLWVGSLGLKFDKGGHLVKVFHRE